MGQHRAKPVNTGRCNDYPEREYTQASGSGVLCETEMR